MYEYNTYITYITYVCMYIHIHIYIYIYRERERCITNMLSLSPSICKYIYVL